MLLSLNDPGSIVRWWRVFPERHWDLLEGFELRSPQFRAAICEARQRIRTEAHVDRLSLPQEPGTADTPPLPLGAVEA